MNFFTAPIYTKDELNAEYKLLCKKLHPDVKGGNEAAFKAMKSEYDKIKSEMVCDRWVRPNPYGDKVYYKKRGVSVTVKPNKKETYNVTPEDIKKGLEILEQFFKIFNNRK